MIVVSSCLLGLSCRYDGKEKADENVLEYLKDKEFIGICPEQMGGLNTPRDPAEIVSENPLCIMTESGCDVTREFVHGTDQVMKLLEFYKVDQVILKSKSPTCGTYERYDGTFSRNLIDKPGIMAKRLMDENIKVMNETDLA